MPLFPPPPAPPKPAVARPAPARPSLSSAALQLPSSVKVLFQVAGSTTPPPTVPPSDSPGFLDREAAVRHDFLQVHPPFLGPLAKYVTASNTTEAELFAVAAAQVAGGRLDPPPTKLPGYWKRQAIATVHGLPFGGTIAESMAGPRNSSDPNPAAIDKLARQNMEAFGRMVSHYGGPAASEAFTRGTPLEKAQLLMAAFQGFFADIDFPCPYTVYLLDVSQNPGYDQAGFDKQFYRGLTAGTGEDLPHFSSYNRERKTDAFRTAFRHILDAGQEFAQDGSREHLPAYARVMSMTAQGDAGRLTLLENGKPILDSDMVLSIFGSDELKRFLAQPEGRGKEDTRAAALILYSQMRRVMVGLMLG